MLIGGLAIFAGCQNNKSVPAEKAITAAEIKKYISALANDSMMGRKPFTEGETKLLKPKDAVR